MRQMRRRWTAYKTNQYKTSTDKTLFFDEFWKKNRTQFLRVKISELAPKLPALSLLYGKIWRRDKGWLKTAESGRANEKLAMLQLNRLALVNRLQKELNWWIAFTSQNAVKGASKLSNLKPGTND